MHPILLQLGDLPIHTYGVMIATGFLLCVWMSKREAARIGLPPMRIVDLGFYSLLVGLVGSRLLFVITQWEHFMQYPISMFYVWEGGLVFYGGPLAAIPFFIWYTRHYKMPLWEVLDIGAQAVCLAHAFGRLGCFGAGCCYGKPTSMPWGVVFRSDLVDITLRHLPLHPTQLYESFCLFGLFLALRYRRKAKRFTGELAVIYLIAYPVIRSVIETFRGDAVRGFVIDGILSTSQFISLFVAAAGVALYVRMRRRRKARA